MTVWDSVHGSRAVDGLARQISSGEIPNAWLLVGPRGAAKGAVARAMAAALECPTSPGVGCGSCATCTRVLRQRHPDVHQIAPEGPLIPVDVIRDSVIIEAARSPFEAARKVFVIEEAERMNPSAQNALLKTLEEPQPDTVFILVAEQEDELLETIRSRCRVVRLEQVPEGRVSELLQRDGASHDLAGVAARVSEGDVERAKALAFDDDVRKRRALWATVPDRLFSSLHAFDAAAEILDEARHAVRARERAQRSEVTELAEAMGEGRGTAAARNALAKRHRRELRRLEEEILGDALQTIASFYRDVISVRSEARDAVLNGDLMERLESWARSDVTNAALAAAVERCIVARAALSKNANQSLAIEATLVELARLVPPRAEVRA